MSTELEQQLHGAMERFTDDVRVPPGLAARADQRRRARRARTRVVTAAGTGAAIAAAGLAVAGVTGAFGSAGPQQTQRATYTAYVVSHVEHALASSRVDSLLERDRTVYVAGTTLRPGPTGLTERAHGAGGASFWPAGYSLDWSYRGTTKFSAFTAAGQRVFDLGLTSTHRTLSTTAVFYRNHTWWAVTPGIRLPRGNGPGPSGCLRGRGIVLRRGQGNGWPAFIRSQLACGAYTVVGRQVVGGINAIKITGASGQFTFWVNPATYLPVQMTLGNEQTSFQWLAPTPADLAQLKVTAPAGFKQVTPPSTQGQ